MRLDHLLSREPVLGMHAARCFWVVCFLCLHFDTARCGWWVWVRLRVGHFKRRQACCRVHVQHLLGVWPMTVDAGWFVWCWWLCGVLFVICIVVDEHLYCNVKPIL